MTTAPLNLWLTSRTAYETGIDHCPRDRYLSNHAGPHGYGYERKALSLPAVTGSLVHDPIAAILGHVRDTDQLPDPAWVYQHAISPAVLRYNAMVEARGLAAITDEAELAKNVLEQITLLEGLIWTFHYGVLPQFHVEHRVVLVEREGISVVGCTCGLGDRVGSAEDHDARECQGIGYQQRADCVAERRDAPGHYRYFEFKTTSELRDGWVAQWQHRVQLISGILSAEEELTRRVGHPVEIEEVYVPALIKGKRQSEWNPDEGKASGPKYQSGRLVYGGRRSANAPLWGVDWTPEWSGQFFVDGDGKRRKRAKEYARTGIWEVEGWQGVALSPSHYWVQWLLPTGVLSGCYSLVGPIYRSGWKLDTFLRQLVGEERKWQDIIWQLYDATQHYGSWAHPEVQALLDKLVPQARGSACENFFGDRCGKLAICDRYDGWEDPLTMGNGALYVPRRPHHTAELAQAIGRGLMAPTEGLAEQEED